MNTHLIQRLCTDVPLLAHGALAAFLQPANLARTLEIQNAEHPFYKVVRERMKPQATLLSDGIAIVPVEGLLMRKPSVWELFDGVEDTNNIHEMIDSAARNPDVTGLLLDVDSPGGFMTGGPEVADTIKQVRKTKPVVAWTGGLMASLAYWIGSQAESVVATRSAIVGSIGAFTTHVDYTKFLESLGIKVELFKNKDGEFKAAGVTGVPLTDSQRENIQSRVETSFKEFKRAVTSARADLKDDSMRGQTFSGAEAKSAGLVDRIGDRNFALSVLRSAIRARA